MTIDDEFPLPGTKINDSIVIASVYYRESDDELRSNGVPGDIYTLLLLNPESPYYTVRTCYRATFGGILGWKIEDEYHHMNIVPAVNGEHPNMARDNDVPGYVDMGGDY